MHVHNAYKFKMDRINNNREKVAASIFRRSRAANSSVRGVIWPNFIFMQALMYVIITYKYERIRSRTAVKKVAKQFSHYKYMGIISDARGQLTLLSVVEVGQISNSSGLCMLSLPVNMKRIVRKTAKKKWQHRFFRHSVASYSVVRFRIWPNFELIKALKCVIVTCKYEEDQIKTAEKSGNTVFPNISIRGLFSDPNGQLTSPLMSGCANFELL